jgi:hypothetical protein
LNNPKGIVCVVRSDRDARYWHSAAAILGNETSLYTSSQHRFSANCKKSMADPITTALTSSGFLNRLIACHASGVDHAWSMAGKKKSKKKG